LRERGSHGGHRGLESVIYQLETERSPRLRIGIGDSVEGEILKEYVLQEFNEAEKERLPEVVARASDAVIIYLCEPMEKAMSMVNATNTL
jgi:PTH1 family peptidyl-tRNA hydrolase